MAQEKKYKARVTIVNVSSNDLVVTQEYSDITKDHLQKLYDDCDCYGQDQSPLSNELALIKTEEGKTVVDYITYSGISRQNESLVSIIAWGTVPAEKKSVSNHNDEEGPVPYEIVVDKDTDHHMADFKYYEGLRYVESTGIKHSFAGELNTYYVSCGDIRVTVEPKAFPNVPRRFI